MFGLSDNSQTNNSQMPANQPGDNSAPPLPPSPFIEEQTPSGHSVTAPPLDHGQPAEPADQSAPAPTEDMLIELKEQALSSLSPLVTHLDQTPEERFKTMMMLIQASDNSKLIKEAYEAANQIADEKARAQALLDVINEINYFTQKGGQDRN